MDNMIIIEIDGESYEVADMSIEQLEYVGQQLLEEIDRKRLLRDVEKESEELTRRYLAARDGRPSPNADAPEWIQPQGSLDAYLVDYQVVYDGKTWINLTPFNVWAPPTGWRENTSGTPQWVRPSGAHDAYKLGNRVMFEGQEYISRMDANVHSPLEHPPGWEIYPIPEEPGDEIDLPEEPPIEEPDPEDPPIVEPEPPTDPEEPPVEEPEYPVWEPWDNIRPLYQIGGRVTHKGSVWESTVGNNHWEPGVYGWKQLG